MHSSYISHVKEDIVFMVEQLVVKAKNGNKEAFTELVELFRDMAIGYAYAYLNEWETAQEVAQEAFIQAYKSINGLSVPRAFPAWFKRIVHFSCIRVLRKKTTPTCNIDEVYEIIDTSPSPIDITEQKERQLLVRQALQGLNDDERTVIMLYYWGGKSYKDIASFLGISFCMVNNRISRARIKLRENLLPVFQEDYINRKERLKDMNKKIINILNALHRRYADGSCFTGMVCSLAGAMTAALQVCGEDITYEEVMGLSGAAYRIAFRKEEWDYSSVDGLIGFDHVTPLMSALGYDVKFHYGRCDRGLYHRLASCDCTVDYACSYEENHVLKKVIINSINRGIPVVAIDLIHIPEWGVITGYGDEGNTLYCRTYMDELEGEDHATAERVPWFFITLEKHNKKPNEKEALLNSIKVFKSSMNIPWYDVYANGYNAYDIWAAELINEKMDTLSKQILTRRASVNTFCLDSLKDSRIAAAVYLQKVTKFLHEDLQQLMIKACELFEEIVQKIQSLDSEGMLLHIDDLDLDKRPWTTEMRQKTSKVLLEIKDIEKRIEEYFNVILQSEM